MSSATTSTQQLAPAGRVTSGGAAPRAQLRVVQLNCMRSKAVMADLGQMMLEEQIDVALLQEPYAYHELRGLPAQYSGFVSLNNPNTANTAIAVRKSLQPMQVHSASEQWGSCCSINWCGRNIFVASVYCKWDGDMVEHVNVIERFRRAANGEPFIVGLDANATNALWYSKPNRSHDGRLQERGEVLADYVIDARLQTLNLPSVHFTYVGTGRRLATSDVDATFVNASWADAFESSWELRTDRTTSDHNLIQIVVASQTVEEEAVQDLRWTTRGADWQHYVEALRSELGSGRRNAELSLEEQIESLHATVQRTNDAQFPRLSARTVRTTRWWTSALRLQRRELRKARKHWQAAKARSLPNVGDLGRDYNRKQKEYNRAILKAKQQHWHNFVREEGNTNPWGRVYRFCRGKRTDTPLSAIRRSDGSLTNTRADSVKVLLETFFPARAPDQVDAASDVDGSGGDPITADEIDAAFHAPRRDKAPGPDGLTATMIRHLWYAAPDELQQLFERCRMEGVFPARWKVSRLVILLKAPDKDRTDPRSYRPICLLSVLGKALERVMVNRLLERTTPHPAQFGFTAGRGTEDALLEAKAATDACTETYQLGIFVDFRGAFDNLRWDKVMQRLSTVVADKRLWQSYFSHRTVYVRNGATSIQQEVQRGCPQGSICGPAVWNLCMQTLLVRLEAAGSKVIAYADDLLILVPGNSRAQLERLGTQWMQLVTQWGEEVGVPVNAQKTVQMLLKGKLATSRQPNIRLGDRAIGYSTPTRYLGVHIGERWSFFGHIRELKRKTEIATGALCRVMRKDWGFTLTTALRIYRGLLVPCVGYGAIVWGNVLQKQAEKAAIEKAQRVALRAMVPLCRTVSTAAMQVLAGELPWDLEVRRMAVMARLRKGRELGAADLVQSAQLDGLNAKQRREAVREAFLDEWQRRWDSGEKGRTTHRWIPNVRFVRSRAAFNPTLELGYLLTGHGSLNHSLLRFGLEPTSACPSCGAADETWQHVLVECPAYTDIRRLAEWRIAVTDDGEPVVGRALEEPQTIAELNAFAKEAFRRRKERLQPNRRQQWRR